MIESMYYYSNVINMSIDYVTVVRNSGSQPLMEGRCFGHFVQKRHINQNKNLSAPSHVPQAILITCYAGEMPVQLHIEHLPRSMSSVL